LSKLHDGFGQERHLEGGGEGVRKRERRRGGNPESFDGCIPALSSLILAESHLLVFRKCLSDSLVTE